jgi:aminoglycoside 2'-N-acetyltransferase I
VRCVRSDELGDAEIDALRQLMDIAFDGDFDDHDWDHALGGLHAVLTVDGLVAAHAAVVPRVLYIGDAAVPTGYVEAVATHPSMQGRGFGTQVMRAIVPEIERIGFGALATGSSSFYERLGWRRWRGPTYVIGRRGWHRSPDEDDAIMVLTVPGGPSPAGTEPIACENRPGDAW